MINNISDVGIYLQIGGILVGLTTTRYLFYCGIVIWYLLGHMKRLVPEIDFGEPSWSEFKIMYRLYGKIWWLQFLKSLKFILNKGDNQSQQNISKLMMVTAVLMVILGLLFQHSNFHEHVIN